MTAMSDAETLGLRSFPLVEKPLTSLVLKADEALSVKLYYL